MIYGTQITIVNGVYKPTNITGGPHIFIVFLSQISQEITTFFHLQATAGDLLPERVFWAVSRRREKTLQETYPAW